MKTDPFSIRLSQEQHERLINAVAATKGTYSKTDFIVLALDVYMTLLEKFPSMLPEYDPELDKSVTHLQTM